MARLRHFSLSERMLNLHDYPTGGVNANGGNGSPVGPTGGAAYVAGSYSGSGSTGAVNAGGVYAGVGVAVPVIICNPTPRALSNCCGCIASGMMPCRAARRPPIIATTANRDVAL